MVRNYIMYGQHYKENNGIGIYVRSCLIVSMKYAHRDPPHDDGGNTQITIVRICNVVFFFLAKT